MSEHMKKLMELLAADETAADKVFACKTMESAFAAATAIVDGYTFDEFKAAMELLKNMAEKTKGAEISDKELDDVAGGVVYNAAAERFKRGWLNGEHPIDY